MPLYEYSCSRCEGRFEFLQRIGASSTGLACPECGSESLDREFSTFASCGSDGSNDAAACSPRSGFT